MENHVLHVLRVMIRRSSLWERVLSVATPSSCRLNCRAERPASAKAPWHHQLERDLPAGTRLWVSGWTRPGLAGGEFISLVTGSLHCTLTHPCANGSAFMIGSQWRDLYETRKRHQS